MSLVFYFSPMSTATLTSIVLEELGIPCERKRLDLKAGEQKAPAFRAINPNAKVPTIVHDGVAIWESAAITIYLGEQFGVERGLYPPPGPQRGQAMSWIVWTNVTLGEAVYRRGHNGEWAPPGEGNPKAVAQAERDLAELLGILDAALADRQFLVGEYSLADTHLNSFCDWLRHSKIDFAPFVHVNAWSARCAARPAYQRAMAAEMG